MKELTLRTQVPIEITIKGYAGKYEKATANPRNLQIQIDEEAKIISRLLRQQQVL